MKSEESFAQQNVLSVMGCSFIFLVHPSW